MKRPRVVVDIGGIDELRGIRDAQGGLEIGAMSTLTQVINHSRVSSEFSLLATAADNVATPQIRNQGNARRQCVAGHALLVLPERMAVLSGRGQHVLRLGARGHESRACDHGSEPVCGGEPVGHSACSDSPRREDDRTEPRSSHIRGRGFFHRTVYRHHAG